MKEPKKAIALVVFSKAEAVQGADLFPPPLSPDPTSNSPASEKRSIVTVYAEPHLTERLTPFLTEEHQIYLFGHCGPGLDYLANRPDVGSHAARKISAAQIEQLLARMGLSKESRARIKVFACESGLASATGSAFATHLATAMSAYRCSIFGYTAKLSNKWHEPRVGDTEEGAPVHWHKKVAAGAFAGDKRPTAKSVRKPFK